MSAPRKPARKRAPKDRRDTGPSARDRRPTRSERIAAQREREARRRKRSRIAAGVVVGLVIAIVAAYLVNQRRQEQAQIAALETASCRYDIRADSDRGPGNNHIADPTYAVDPPAGGDHVATPARAGVYLSDNAPPDGQVVHSLEHGYVVIWERPGLGDDDRKRIAGAVDPLSRDVLVVSRPSLAVPVAATAWHRRLLCQQAEPDTLARFVRDFRNQGPEQVPH